MSDAAMFPASDKGRARLKHFTRLKWTAFVLTFFAYTSFHLSRKPASIVKNVLHPSSPDGQSTYNASTNPGWAPFNQDLVPSVVARAGLVATGAEDTAVNGLYTCNRSSIVPIGLDSVCQTWVKAGGMSIRRFEGPAPGSTGHDPADRTCWQVVDAAGRTLYYQKVSRRKSGDGYVCSPLPLITTVTNNKYWLAAPGMRRPAPSVAPNLTNGKILLGVLDTVFLATYAAGLFVSGHIGDHVNLRWFLALGMVGSGTFVGMLGMGYYWHVHKMWFYVLVYIVQGFFQAIGWPSVVGVVGSWWGQRTRGGAMGVWNAHTSCGNIFGSLVSVAALGIGMNGNDWPMAFFIPGGIIFTMGLIVAAFLIAHPHDVDLPSPNDTLPPDASGRTASTPGHATSADDAAQRLLSADLRVTHGGRYQSTGTAPRSPGANGAAPFKGVRDMSDVSAGNDLQVLQASPSQARKNRKMGGFASFVRALCIPGVIPFAMALFFAKLVAYTFIYWLPLYLSHINYSTDEAGRLSTFFDLGGIVGGVTAGFLSDKLRMRAFVAWMYLLLALPGLYFYRVLTRHYGDSSLSLNILFMLVCGAIVNGPYALITTAVSADLGSHKSLKDDSKLLASVTGIIDGTGSIGAALQGVLISWISSQYSWNAVFYALIACSLSSALLLSRLVWKEVRNRLSGKEADEADEEAAPINKFMSPGAPVFGRARRGAQHA